MTDNYNDDYREVIPEEEKTETTLNENRDNEKNSENTQVADTAGENSAEKKTEDKKDSSEYEDVCFICRRPESKAGRMFKLPNHICICDDCMHKTMETVSQFDSVSYTHLLAVSVKLFTIDTMAGMTFSTTSDTSDST